MSFPQFQGTHSSYTSDMAPVTPFAGVTLSDSGTPDPTERVTIIPSGQGGTLSDGSGYDGPQTLQYTYIPDDPNNSYYSLTGPLAQVNQELDDLSFVPNPGNVGTTTSTVLALMDLSSSGSISGFHPDTGTVVYNTTTMNEISLTPQVTYANGTFTLTGHVSTTAGFGSVDISAVVDGGARQDLGPATLGPNGTFTFQDRVGANVQGLFEATATDGAGGQATSADPLFSLQGGLGPYYGAGRQTRFTADGEAQTAVTRFRPFGSENVQVQGSGQTFASAYADTFDDNYISQTTFVFNPGYSLDVVDQFRLRGPGHDTLSFLGSDFGSTPQSQLGSLLAHSYESGGSFFIVDPTTQDVVQLKGVSTSQFAHNERDVVFR